MLATHHDTASMPFTSICDTHHVFACPWWVTHTIYPSTLKEWLALGCPSLWHARHAYHSPQSALSLCNDGPHSLCKHDQSCMMPHIAIVPMPNSGHYAAMAFPPWLLPDGIQLNIACHSYSSIKTFMQWLCREKSMERRRSSLNAIVHTTINFFWVVNLWVTCHGYRYFNTQGYSSSPKNTHELPTPFTNLHKSQASFLLRCIPGLQMC